MKRKILIVLFSFGTVAGFGSGIASMARCHGERAHHRRAAFEQHVAAVCLDAAMQSQAAQAAPAPAPQPALYYPAPSPWGPPAVYAQPPAVYAQPPGPPPAHHGCDTDRGPHRGPDQPRPWR